MRLAIFADVHGNLAALEAVIADARREGVESFLFAGDLVGGPQVDETAMLIRSLGGWMILGNRDMRLVQYAAGEGPEVWRTSRQWRGLRWAFHHTGQETRELLAALPEQSVVRCDGRDAIRLVHGSPRNAAEGLFPDRKPEGLERALAQVPERVMICAHTHRAWKRQVGGRLALNPGAVSESLDGIVGAQYALLEWRGGHWEAEHRRVDYDVERVRAACEESGILAEGGGFVRALLDNIIYGHREEHDFYAHIFGLARRAGCREGEIPDALWEEAERTFDWEAIEGKR